MSGLSVFCIIKSGVSNEKKKKLFHKIESYSFDIHREEKEWELSYIGVININGTSYHLQDDFEITFHDIDFSLNYPDFLDDIFLTRYQINFETNISVSTSVKNEATTKVVITLLKDILSIFDAQILVYSVTNKENSTLIADSREVELSNGKRVYILDKSDIRRIGNFQDQIYLS